METATSLDGHTVDRVEFVVAPREVVRYFVRFKQYYKGGHTTTKYKNFATLRGAASRIAWWLVGERYGVALDQTGEAVSRHIPAFLAECDCYDGPDCYGMPWEGCLLHSRDFGYFARLHDRVTAWIEKGYLMAGAIQELDANA